MHSVSMQYRVMCRTEKNRLTPFTGPHLIFMQHSRLKVAIWGQSCVKKKKQFPCVSLKCSYYTFARRFEEPINNISATTYHDNNRWVADKSVVKRIVQSLRFSLLGESADKVYRSKVESTPQFSSGHEHKNDSQNPLDTNSGENMSHSNDSSIFDRIHSCHVSMNADPKQRNRSNCNPYVCSNCKE